MQRGGVEIILERRTGRKVAGCAAIGIVVGFLACLAIEPGEALPLLAILRDPVGPGAIKHAL